MRGAALLLVAALVGGCRPPRFTEPLRLAEGKVVSVETLEEGHEAYQLYCYACHGEKGDGRGPSAPGMRPPPRDFTQGMFKFAGVPAGGLPNDDDLDAVIRNGLSGTAMLPWDVSARERQAVIQYLKSFSPRWKEEAPAAKVLPDGADPWRDDEIAAIELGKLLYHFSGARLDSKGQLQQIYAGCSTCHPAYLSEAELRRLAQITTLPPVAREDLHRPAAKETDYLVGDHKLAILPTDFLLQPVKNGTTLPSLYRTIAAGVGGTAMPVWKPPLDDRDLWALAYYVRGLAQLRGTRAGLEVLEKLSPAKLGASP
jgi:mono/diheme cytochrome c family protein